MRDQVWNNPEWNEIRDEANKAIYTAERLFQVGGGVDEGLISALASLKSAKIHAPMKDIHTATVVLRRATAARLLRTMGAREDTRNGTSGVTGVENPDGEPNRDEGAV